MIDFLSSCHSESQPFFAMQCIGTPHFPNDMPQYWRQMYDPARITLPVGVPDPDLQSRVQRWKLEIDQDGDENGLNWSKVGDCTKGIWETETEGEIRGFIAEYYALVSNIDHNLGRILHWLDRTQLADDTIVIFLSDHGDMHGQKGHFCGIKRSPYRESMQVPFLLRYPRRFPRAREIDALYDVSIDTMPTLLSLCGLPIPSAVQGIDQSAVFDGQEVSLRDAVYYELLSQTGGGEPADYVRIPERGIRTKDWMYCRKPERRKYLYNLRDDPGELTNLVDDAAHEDIMSAFDDQLETHMAATADDWGLQVRFPLSRHAKCR